jgi:phosphatidylinositol alpha-1,6-mannosyltransferase
LAIDAGVRAERIDTVHPGVDLPADAAPADAIADFRLRHRLEGRPLLLSVGRLSERKGLREFVSDVLPTVVAAKPEVVLLIVGDAPKQALHARSQSMGSIRDAAQAKGIGDSIRFLGVIVDRTELATVYEAADVHVFPVRQIPHDPEGFGMVAIEAAAHGLPTVAYATGGVVEAVDDHRSGRLVAPGDVDAMARAVLEMIDRRGEMQSSARSFAAGFAWPIFSGHLSRILNALHD